MVLEYETIRQANEAIKTTELKHKDKDGNIIVNAYAEVNQRIKAFRMVFPTGFIKTEMVSNENGVCIFRAYCGYYDDNGEPVHLSSGTAYEKEGSSYINKTSYIENCETSAVGRALGIAGFGIDTALASADEITNAERQQEEQEEQKEEPKVHKASAKQVEILKKYYTGANLKKLLEKNGLEKIEDIPLTKASELIKKISKGD